MIVKSRLWKAFGTTEWYAQNTTDAPPTSSAPPVCDLPTILSGYLLLYITAGASGYHQTTKKPTKILSILPLSDLVLV